MEGFSEVIPVTVVTSFPHRLVITIVVGKLAGNVSRVSEAEWTPEVECEGSRSGHKQQDNSKCNSRDIFQQWVYVGSHFS